MRIRQWSLRMSLGIRRLCVRADLPRFRGASVLGKGQMFKSQQAGLL